MRKHFTAMLLAVIMVFTMASGATTVFAMTTSEVFNETLRNNQNFLALHEPEMIGLPLSISDEARALSNEIVGTETDAYQKAKKIYDWMV